MLLCQDENRNHARKSNTAKKEQGEEVKLGRRKISKGIWCLASLMNRCSWDVTFPLFGNISSKYISKSSWTHSTAATICSSQFPYASHASFSSPSRTPSCSSHLSKTYSKLWNRASCRQTYAKAIYRSSWFGIDSTHAETPAWPRDRGYAIQLRLRKWWKRGRATKEGSKEASKESAQWFLL